ncbi:hypothetical protein FB567DRAFT_1031 [Paraphoma chrysanthemicola]|uniref:Uncharacterized protein n=1 Tax=Paraphoma chrysanthemicola TaxID=798071 RepID=A0A8K0W4L4_9PLEO|nr:hypothetical protein FB567DRAFT_1031 [Paraphoma chrysanthemicola]
MPPYLLCYRFPRLPSTRKTSASNGADYIAVQRFLLIFFLRITNSPKICHKISSLTSSFCARAGTAGCSCLGRWKRLCIIILLVWQIWVIISQDHNILGWGEGKYCFVFFLDGWVKMVLVHFNTVLMHIWTCCVRVGHKICEVRMERGSGEGEGACVEEDASGLCIYF